MTTTDKAKLYRAAGKAGAAWMEEIRKAFPRQHAGGVRYAAGVHGNPGSSLRAAYDTYKAARDAWMAVRR